MRFVSLGISTVSTQVSQGLDPFDFFGFGFGGGGGFSYDTTAIGTGVIVDEAGYILTNSHVVNDGDTKSITVSLYDGQDVEGRVLWNDSALDLAVVKIESENLQAAELADSDLVNIGSYAAAIGNPLGLQFERSISQGIISGLDRTITVSLPDKAGREAIFKVHARNKTISKDVSFENLAKRTVGFSGADIENILNEAAILAVRANKEAIDIKDIDETIEQLKLEGFISE